MLRIMCRSKIHRAAVTRVDLHYAGSIGIDGNLLKASDICPNEIVQVVNINNGARFETYIIEEPNGSGTIALYGGTAHLGKVGDILIIFSYGLVEDNKAKSMKLKVIHVDSTNRIIRG